MLQTMTIDIVEQSNITYIRINVECIFPNTYTDTFASFKAQFPLKGISWYASFSQAKDVLGQLVVPQLLPISYKITVI